MLSNIYCAWNNIFKKKGEDENLAHFSSSLVLSITQGFFLDNCQKLYFIFNSSGEIHRSYLYILISTILLIISNFIYFSSRKEVLLSQYGKRKKSNKLIFKILAIGSFVALLAIMIVLSNIIRTRNGF
jgi:hypothetical protein